MDETQETYRLFDWLAGTVNFPVPASLIRAIFAERGVTEDIAFADADATVRDLCKADLYSRIALTSPNRQGAVSDGDNGWSHSDGGFTLTEEDKKLLLSEANAIYEANGEPAKGKRTTVSITHFGIRRRCYPTGIFPGNINEA